MFVTRVSLFFTWSQWSTYEKELGDYHFGAVISVVVLPHTTSSDTLFATAGADGTFRVWDYAKRRCARPAPAPGLCAWAWWAGWVDAWVRGWRSVMRGLECRSFALPLWSWWLRFGCGVCSGR
jgi:hypothetical protein